MKEQLINYDTAVLAKEKGFLGHSTYYWNNHRNKKEATLDSIECIECEELILNYSNEMYIYQHLAPTQYLLQKWLREKHNLFVYVVPTFMNEKFYCKCVNLKYTNDDLFHGVVWGIHFDTYEETLEKGLYEALKLIK